MDIIYNKQVIKGKNIVLSIILITNMFYWVNFFLSLNIRDTEILIKQIFAIALIVLISFLFYKGFNVAEWFAYSLLIQPVLTLTFYLLDIIGILELYNGWFMLIVAILIVLIGGILIANQNSIDEFMKYQRDKRKRCTKYYK